eukprot:6537219-Alexandrium_andersonii.AAC.1
MATACQSLASLVLGLKASWCSVGSHSCRRMSAHFSSISSSPCSTSIAFAGLETSLQCQQCGGRSAGHCSGSGEVCGPPPTARVVQSRTAEQANHSQAASQPACGRSKGI